MKKTHKKFKLGIAVAALTLVLSACGAQNNGSESPSASPTSSSTPLPTASDSDEPGEDPGELILKQFQDSAMASPPANELFASFKELIAEVEPAQADDMVRSLEDYYVKNLPGVEKEYEAENVQQLLSKSEWPITEEKAESIGDEAVRDLVQRTYAGGYKLITAEGFIFPIVDYGKLVSYADKMSISMKAYLDVMATESDAATARDAGLVITWDELANRALASESYVVAFPDTPERKAIETKYLNYLNMYLIGLNNTPIFDYDTFLILPEVKSQYEQMASTHAGTITGQLTKELLSILDKTEGAVFTKSKNGEQTNIPAIQQFRDKINSSAISKLPASKN